jgi:hypothetical protein
MERKKIDKNFFKTGRIFGREEELSQYRKAVWIVMGVHYVLLVIRTNWVV